jgi:hypothetical protein
MDIYALLFFVIVLFMGIIMVISSYYEYSLNRCRYEKSGIIQKQKNEKDPYMMKPILERDTNLEKQYEDSPYTLYKSYFDQPSPWIGTEYSHKSDDEEYIRSI